MRYFPLLLLLLSACGSGREYYAPGTALAPNADLEVTVAAGPRSPMTVEVDRLVPASDIHPDARRFAVWVQQPGGVPELEGFLRYDSDARSGRLHTVSPDRDFRVIVTAENVQTPAWPSDDVVAERVVMVEAGAK